METKQLENFLNEQYQKTWDTMNEWHHPDMYGDWVAPPEHCECCPRPKREKWRSFKNSGHFHEGFEWVQYPTCPQCGARTGPDEPVVTSWSKELSVPDRLLHYFVDLMTPVERERYYYYFYYLHHEKPTEAEQDSREVKG